MLKVGDTVHWGNSFAYYGVITGPKETGDKYPVTWLNKKTHKVWEAYKCPWVCEGLYQMYTPIKEEKMSPLTINWGTKTLKFDDLAVRETFIIDTPLSHGTVYMKIEAPKNGGVYQLELGTGKAFPATKSPVKRVDAELNVASPQPK